MGFFSSRIQTCPKVGWFNIYWSCMSTLRTFARFYGLFWFTNRQQVLLSRIDLVLYVGKWLRMVLVMPMWKTKKVTRGGVNRMQIKFLWQEIGLCPKQPALARKTQIFPRESTQANEWPAVLKTNQRTQRKSPQKQNSERRNEGARRRNGTMTTPSLILFKLS